MGLGSDLSLVVVDSMGHCFFCLSSHGRSPSSGPAAKSTSGKLHSLQGLSRYLGMDMKKLSEEMESIPAGADPERSELKAELCHECSSALETFSGLLEQLGIIDEVQVTSSLELIQRKLLSGEDTVKYCDLMDSMGDDQDGWRKVDMLRALRVEAIQKCSQKLTQAPPLGSLTEVPPGSPLSKTKAVRPKGKEVASSKGKPTIGVNISIKSTRDNLSAATEPEVKEECPSPVRKSEPEDGDDYDPVDDEDDAEETINSGIQRGGHAAKTSSSRRRTSSLLPPPPIILNHFPNSKVDDEVDSDPGGNNSDSDPLEELESESDEGSGPDPELQQAAEEVDLTSSSSSPSLEIPPPKILSEPMSTPVPRSKKYIRVGERFRCCTCSKEYGCKQTVSTHYRLNHRSNTTSAVDGKQFEKDPETDLYPCGIGACTKTFKHPAGAVYHYERTHLKMKLKFQCSHNRCDQKFPTRQAYKIHYRNSHREASQAVEGNGPEVQEAAEELPRSRPKFLDSLATVTVTPGQKIYTRDPATGQLHRVYPKKSKAGPASSKHKNTQPIITPVPVDGVDGQRYTKVKSGRYRCSLCKNEYAQASSASTHYRRIHLKEKGAERKKQKKKLRAYKCPKCDKTFSTLGGYKTHHINVHQGIRFACPKCPGIFTREITLKQHMTAVHLKLQQFVCGQCGKSFGRRTNLQIHLKTVHASSMEEHRCEECGKGFSVAFYLRRHMAKAHVKSTEFQCDLCDKGFSREVSLTQHKRIMHPPWALGEAGTDNDNVIIT